MKSQLISAFALSFALTSSPACYAQIPFSTMSYVDINNIKANVLVHGDMWWNPTTQLSQCEFPKGSGKNIAFAGAIWMSGYDAGNKLHISSQSYRQVGNDYWPGPLDDNDTVTYQNSQNWAKIWKINQTDINAFRSQTSHTTTNTPNDILTWPAKGNPYARGGYGAVLTIDTDMAPFVDVDGDGNYNALNGDYPAIKGDQALWWIFSDNGATHNETNGQPLKVEVHCMAYAYSRGTLIDNVIYYDYNIVNKSSEDYTNFRIGQFADLDLGYNYDDYIGFDSLHRMGYIYNSKAPDGTGQTGAYGYNIPIAGVTMIDLPGDSPSNIVPAGSFMYFNNDFSPTGFPIGGNAMNNYMRARWNDSTHLINDFTGHNTPSTGHNAASTDYTNYVYPGNPTDTTQWSECASGNVAYDRKFVIASDDFVFPANSNQHVVIALVTTNLDTDHVCGNFNYADIENVADTAWYVYSNPLPTDVHNITVANNNMLLYPNPAHNSLFVKTGYAGSGQESMMIYNILGQTVNVPTSRQPDGAKIDISMLPPGIYHILYRNGDLQKTAGFVKE